MPSFSYEGLNAQGQPTSGTLICNSISEAKTQLQGRHIFITKLYEGDAVAEAAVKSGVAQAEVDLAAYRAALEERNRARA